MSTCHCGATADVRVAVYKDDPTVADRTWVTCYEHLPEVLASMESYRAEVDGVLKVRNERQSAYTLAWFLIDRCPHVLHGPEWAILFQLARRHQEGYVWVEAQQIVHPHGGGSIQNVRELLRRPRLSGRGVDPKGTTLPDWLLVEERDYGGVPQFRLRNWDGP